MVPTDGIARVCEFLLLDEEGLTPGYPENGCPGCTMFADNLPQQLIHLNARDTTMVFVSAGSQEAISAYRSRMEWGDWPWYTTREPLLGGLQRRSVVWHQRLSAGRRSDLPHVLHDLPAAEELSSIWALLDITPFGRQEQWQGAPEGVPQDRTGSWMRRSDEYTTDELAARRTG